MRLESFISRDQTQNLLLISGLRIIQQCRGKVLTILQNIKNILIVFMVFLVLWN